MMRSLREEKESLWSLDAQNDELARDLRRNSPAMRQSKLTDYMPETKERVFLCPLKPLRQLRPPIPKKRLAMKGWLPRPPVTARKVGCLFSWFLWPALARSR